MSSRGILTLLLLAVPCAGRAQGAVLLLPAIGSPGRVSVSGRVLKDEPTGGSSTLSKNLRRLMASNWEDCPVEVRYGGKSVNVVSGHDGNFEAVFEQPEGKGFACGIQRAEAVAKGARSGVAAVEVLAQTAPFFVVSDFDDTVAVSEVLSKRKLLSNALLKDESTQPVVKGMSEFYGCLREGPGPPAFALVSGSPIQYGSRIGAFLARHRFPPMGLYLRDLGPNTLSGYKQPVIRALLNGLTNKVVLIGDSGEQDPEVYREISAEAPDRVLRIYIRNAGRTEDPARFAKMVLFNEPKEAALDALAQGLVTKECVAKAFP